MSDHESRRAGESEPIDHDGEVGRKYAPHDSSHDARYAGRWIATMIALAAMYFGGMGVHEAWQQRRDTYREARLLTGGDPDRGLALLRPYGCARCHVIPGVDGADGQIGPPLAGIANRMYVAGVVTNTPANMVQWIVNPKVIDSKTAMPAVGVTQDQARDIAAYLYTLR